MKRRPRKISTVSAAFWHPLVLYPLGMAVFCLVFLRVLRTAGIAGIIVGIIGAAVGFLYNIAMLTLVKSGEPPAPRVANGEEPLLIGVGLRQALVRLQRSEDLVDAFDRFELITREVHDSLTHPSVSPTIRDLFQPMVLQNEETAQRFFNQLLDVHGRLLEFEQAANRHGEGFETKIAQLRDQRARILAHLDQMLCLMERLSVDVSTYGDEPMEEARRQLGELQQSLETARRVYRDV